MDDSQRPPMRLSGPVLGALDPVALAEFYERLLGWPVAEREQGWAVIRNPAARQKIEFQYEPFFVPPVWPPINGEQQLLSHLDIGVPDLEAGVAWAIAAGATEAGHQPQDDVRVMRDPAGQLFCLFADEPES